MKFNKPKFWDNNYYLIPFLLLPITLIITLLIFLKKKFTKPIKFNSFIICVGNIYVGGTGKTPTSILLCNELLKLEKDYKSIGYSIDEINIQKHRFYSLPFLLCVMTIIATIIMIYNKFNRNILLNLFIGIFFSVLVYYLSNFSNLLGENGRLPLILSVWFPVITLAILSIIGVLKLNEK